VVKAGGPEIFVREVLSAVRFALTR
jgi:hypothetical protein